MANLMALISKKEWKKLSRDGADHLGTSFHIDRYNSSHKALAPLAAKGSRLFLVTVTTNDRLLLVGMLEKLTHDGAAWVGARNIVPTRNITALKEPLGLTAAPGKLGMSLQTPRTVSDEHAELLRAVATGKMTALEAIAKPKPTNVAKPAKPAKAKAANKSKPRDELKTLIEAAGTQIEEEYLDDLRAKPDKLIARGRFSETVQNIFAGAFDDAADALPLLHELSPFANGAKKLARLESDLKKGVDASELADELLDAFAISTLDALATAIAALATGRDKKVPASVRPLVPHLAQQVTRIQQALAAG